MSQNNFDQIIKAYQQVMASTKDMSGADAFATKLNFALSAQIEDEQIKATVLNFFVANMNMEYPAYTANEAYQALSQVADSNVVNSIVSAFNPETGFGAHGENLSTVGSEYVALYEALIGHKHEEELVQQQESVHTEL